MSNGQLHPEIGKEFLITELRTGLTFANLALTPAGSNEKSDRHRYNARKAYDSFQKFRRRVSLIDSENAELDELADQLRNALARLGEKVA